MGEKPHARIHVLLSRNGQSGVVFRRGPSKKVCALSWDRRDDTFSMGQWLWGRIYERKCDLSPDGKYLIYFAMTGFEKGETEGSWTAISRAPFLKALVLWAKGDCYNGGGLFVGNERYWLDDGYGHKLVRNSHEVSRDAEFQPPSVGHSEWPEVYLSRLVRDGWAYIGVRPETKDRKVTIFEKPAPGGWVLRKITVAGIHNLPGKGTDYDEHELSDSKGRVLSFPGWEWAEVDGSRVVFASEGKLCSAELGATGPEAIRELHDFDHYIFERIRAPY